VIADCVLKTTTFGLFLKISSQMSSNQLDLEPTGLNSMACGKMSNA